MPTMQGVTTSGELGRLIKPVRGATVQGGSNVQEVVGSKAADRIKATL